MLGPWAVTNIRNSLRDRRCHLISFYAWSVTDTVHGTKQHAQVKCYYIEVTKPFNNMQTLIKSSTSLPSIKCSAPPSFRLLSSTVLLCSGNETVFVISRKLGEAAEHLKKHLSVEL